MRRSLMIIVFSAAVTLLGLSGSSCNRKVGCPANEAAHVKPKRNGELPTGGGKTQLFPKNFNKKAKKKRKRN
ncbi:MAG: hypothetical protein H6557_24025 [Lewinellaceae bacterium]|nr:hypothetical protein [Phaeodactylibacter sp.]MCB9039697.1 hypothetical protein [Lewinellaceae bacterium]